MENPEESEKKFLRIPDAAEYIGASEWHIRTLIWERKIPHAKVGKCFVVERKDLDTYIERIKVPSDFFNQEDQMTALTLNLLDPALPAWAEGLFDPVESVADCPEHQAAGDDELFTNCAGCHRATLRENLDRSRSAAHWIAQREQAGLPVPESWRKTSADLHMWEELLEHWKGVSNSLQ